MEEFVDFLAPSGGYYRFGEEESFPWESTKREVWYSLIITTDGNLKKYGFTPSKSQKRSLLELLNKLPESSCAELLGVWSGKYSAHLFCLDIEIAKEKLKLVI